jgi:ABC-type multidrug transport system fused ATPase/permease subunit
VSRRTPESSKQRIDLRGLARVYKVFGRHYRGHSTTLVVAYAGLLLEVMAALFSPWPLKLILDHVILRHPLPAQAGFFQRWVGSDANALLVALVVAFIVLRMVDSLASYVHKVGLLNVAETMTRDIRNRVFAHLQRLSLSFHDSANAGDLIYRLLPDVNDLKIILLEVPDTVANRLLTIVTHIGLMLFLEWRLALIAFSVIPIISYINRRVGRKVKTAATKRRSKESEVANMVLENVTTMALVQAYGREDLQQQRFESENRASLEFGIRAMKLSKVFKRTTDLLMAAGTCGVVYYGGWLALHGHILPGTLVLFVSYLKNLYSPVDKLAGMMLDIAGAQVAADRLLQVVDSDMVIQDAPNAVAIPQIEGRVEYQDVHFAYRKDVEVLKSVSFKVEAGETVALIGPNGAGKSTLMSLLLRFYDPRSGRILIDGHDLREIKLDSLRRGISVVLQESKLFNKTVRENIAFGKAGATDEEVIRAARLAQAHDFIMKMPQGYNSMIEEGGDNLSGGERQRLNIARAIVRDAPIVLLDEPVTALDARTESRVRGALEQLTRGKTTFIVAHKYGTIADADRVLVLEHGRVAAFGTHQQLVETSPWYRTLYESQFRAFESHPTPDAAARETGQAAPIEGTS